MVRLNNNKKEVVSMTHELPMVKAGEGKLKHFRERKNPLSIPEHFHK